MRSSTQAPIKSKGTEVTRNPAAVCLVMGIFTVVVVAELKQDCEFYNCRLSAVSIRMRLEPFRSECECWMVRASRAQLMIIGVMVPR